ncbi:CoA ester lyase [Cupriavidus sp. 2MCAB6]|uniref:HpcH/HpaI aldolase/citrate lyase family protein n=1 Tax=Cupriavidus sp. 2MCAB6 TaxID=3232981 RepID=UPI003F92F3A6
MSDAAAIRAPARSYLFVPATHPERIGRAIGSGADAVIVDFEDAVAPDAKASAREGLAGSWLQWQARAAAAGVSLLVRVNAADSEYHAGDLDWCRARRARDLVLPKADAAALDALALALPHANYYPLMETAAGFADLRAVSRAAGVVRLLLGSIDLMFDLDVADEDEPLDYFRARLVMHSRAAGLPAPVDGVCTAIGDAVELARQTTRARRFGFGAKLLIHPQQVAQVHAGLAPSERERAWARRIVAAAAGAQGAALAVDGKMVDRPVLERARKILRQAG